MSKKIHARAPHVVGFVVAQHAGPALEEISQ